MSFLKKIRSWNLLLFFVTLILGLGITATIYSVRYADRMVKDSLLESADLIAAALDRDEVASLFGNETDLSTPAYLELKEHLIDLAGLNPDVRFVYLTGKRIDEIFFFVDSEPEDSPDLSPPGQVYDEATDVFHDVFDTKEHALEGPVVDRWGTWISSMSPIIDPATGNVIAVVGLDVSAGHYYELLTLYTIVPIVITLLLAGFAFFIYRMAKKEDVLIDLKSELTSIAAHDLRTPLVGINWSLGALLDTKIQDTSLTAHAETLTAMRDASTKLLGTIDDVLEAFSLERRDAKALALGPYDLAVILKEVVSVFTLAAKEKSLHIVLEHFPATISLVGDCPKIKRVFSNLVANAVKYSPKDSVITITYNETPDRHIIEVANDGIQVPTAERANLFQKYYRNKKTAQTAYGMGLGLYYVKRSVELHDGTVRYEAKDGKNIFSVELPKKE